MDPKEVYINLTINDLSRTFDSTDGLSVVVMPGPHIRILVNHGPSFNPEWGYSAFNLTNAQALTLAGSLMQRVIQNMREGIDSI